MCHKPNIAAAHCRWVVIYLATRCSILSLPASVIRNSKPGIDSLPYFFTYDRTDTPWIHGSLIFVLTGMASVQHERWQMATCIGLLRRTERSNLRCGRCNDRRQSQQRYAVDEKQSPGDRSKFRDFLILAKNRYVDWPRIPIWSLYWRQLPRRDSWINQFCEWYSKSKHSIFKPEVNVSLNFYKRD